MKRRSRQLDLTINTWGGKREHAGRKPVPGEKSGVPHRSRDRMSHRAPLHVTMRVASNVYSLRSQRSLRVIRRSLAAGAARFGVLVVQTSVQGNHIHFLVEADDAHELSRAMKGLAVRLARGLNAMMGRRRQQVFADRYHSRVLGSPTAVRNVMRSLRDNRRHPLGAEGAHLPATFVDPYTSERGAHLDDVLPEPTLWLLRVGWHRARGP